MSIKKCSTQPMGGGGTEVSTTSASPRSLQGSSYTINSMDGNYNIEVIENFLNMEVSSPSSETKSGVKGWAENENYTTTFYGTGQYPDVKTLTGNWISRSLSGFFTVNTDYIQFTDDGAWCRLCLLDFDLLRIVGSDNTSFYIVIEFYGIDGSTASSLNTAERNYLLNHNFILFDNTRDDNASVTLRALKDDEIKNYTFLSDSSGYTKKIVVAEYATTKEIEDAIATNGIVKYLYELTINDTAYKLNYNYYYEEI